MLLQLYIIYSCSIETIRNTNCPVGVHCICVIHSYLAVFYFTISHMCTYLKLTTWCVIFLKFLCECRVIHNYVFNHGNLELQIKYFLKLINNINVIII